MDLVLGMSSHSCKLGFLHLLSRGMAFKLIRSCRRGTAWSTVLNSISIRFSTKNFIISCYEAICSLGTLNAIYSVRRYEIYTLHWRIQCLRDRSRRRCDWPIGCCSTGVRVAAGYTFSIVWGLWPLLATFAEHPEFQPLPATHFRLVQLWPTFVAFFTLRSAFSLYEKTVFVMSVHLGMVLVCVVIVREKAMAH